MNIDGCPSQRDDGILWTKQVQDISSSRTGSEYPIITGVDRDFNAEIVVASNNDQLERDDCRENFEAYPEQGTKGGNTRELTTVQTSMPVDPGAGETLTGTWQTPQSLFGQTYNATATIDPDQSVIETCGGQSTDPVEVDCRQGG